MVTAACCDGVGCACGCRRKRQRENKAARKEAEKAARDSEIKRLKNLKKKEIEER